jgi:hypothetical protein
VPVGQVSRGLPWPESAREAGFIGGAASPHITRTIMLADLRRLLAACPPDAGRARYRAAVVDDNVLLKATATTRRKTFVVMGQMYGLEPSVLIFRALRDLWDVDQAAQPLLATLCALARDPTFLATAPAVLDTPDDTEVTPGHLAAAVGAALPARFNARSIHSIAQNAASSWQQAGHLRGKLRKVRQRAVCRPTAVAYALLLGTLADARGDGLFRTLWANVLDAPEHVLREQAQTAARQGWLEYRSSGGVTEVTFAHLLRPPAPIPVGAA